MTLRHVRFSSAGHGRSKHSAATTAAFVITAPPPRAHVRWPAARRSTGRSGEQQIQQRSCPRRGLDALGVGRSVASLGDAGSDEIWSTAWTQASTPRRRPLGREQRSVVGDCSSRCRPVARPARRRAKVRGTSRQFGHCSPPRCTIPRSPEIASSAARLVRAIANPASSSPGPTRWANSRNQRA